MASVRRASRGTLGSVAAGTLLVAWGCSGSADNDLLSGSSAGGHGGASASGGAGATGGTTAGSAGTGVAGTTTAGPGGASAGGAGTGGKAGTGGVGMSGSAGSGGTGKSGNSGAAGTGGSTAGSAGSTAGSGGSKAGSAGSTAGSAGSKAGSGGSPGGSGGTAGTAGVGGSAGAGGGCAPKTCTDLGATCGTLPDGCGKQLDCGTCGAPKQCGALQPNACDFPSSCTNLCKEQLTCPNSGTTSISGKVYAPNGVDPLPGVTVYVPNAAVPAFTPGVTCDKCAPPGGSPLVTAVSGIDGTFKLTNMPAGANIPLVIQTGRWRRQLTIPQVTACMDTALVAGQTRLPRTHAEGDIPQMAFATGGADALECGLRRVGVADSEFTQPTGGGRVHLYTGSGGPGAGAGAGTPSQTTLVGSVATLSQYDMVFFPCQGAQYAQSPTLVSNLLSYVDAGGRLFTTHYSYVWIDNATFPPTATWQTGQQNPTPDPQLATIDTSFARGKTLADWLQSLGATTTVGDVQIGTLRHDFNAVLPASTLWMSLPGNPGVPMLYTFDTPVGAPAAQQCGRVLFNDFHVENATVMAGTTFPNECPSAATPATPAEKLLELMIFDLGACIGP